MTCERIANPGGGEPWTFCGEAREEPAPSCSVCGTAGAEYLCDGPGEKPGTTCDAPLCDGCSVRTSPLVTIPADPALRTVMRWAGGNIHAPIGPPMVGNERRRFLAMAHSMDLYAAEPHDYCPKCAASRERGR